MKPYLFLTLLIAFLWIGGAVYAQDAPLPEQQPTAPPPVDAAPTDAPTETPTETPTPSPTESPTEIPTEPTGEITAEPTAEPPSETPEAPPDDVTETPTATPTLAPTSMPPTVNLDAAMIVEAVAGVPSTVQFTVSDDEAGMVRVDVAADNAAAGAVSIDHTPPVETAPPFNTGVTLTYTAPADFSGVDSVSLRAIDPGGQTVYFTLAVNVVLPVEATLEPTPDPTAIPDQIRIINYDPAASEASIQAMLEALGAVEISRIPQIGAIKVNIPQAVSDTAAALAALSTDSSARAAGLTNIEPELEYQLAAFPNDPYFPQSFPATTNQQWGLMHGAGDASIYVLPAWTISVKDGLGVVVAVLDSGIDTTHPDLVGKLLPGWDFVNDDPNTDDDNSHGTHVAGVIAANTNNGKGIAGIAFNSRLLPVKVCDSLGKCSTYDIAAGIVFAADKGAHIANMSLAGGTFSTTIEGAVRYALSRNVILVAAAGNTFGTDYQYPASHDGVISVAAHDINGAHPSFSTANNRVTVSAPGVDIVSTVPLETDTCELDGTIDGYSRYMASPGCASWSGTSMAAAHVSGIAALLVGDKIATTPATVRDALICSATDAGTPGYDNQFGHGLVKADYALNWNLNSPDCKVTAPNDLFQNATRITTVPFTTTQAIHSRSTTTSSSDPSNGCSPANQTVWYRFTPTVSDYYQITTLGSTYNTDLSVWQMPEEGYNQSINMIACNDNAFGFNNTSLVNVPLTAGQTYYIMVSSVGTADDQILNLDVRRSLMANNVDHQETSPYIAYSGSWVQSPMPGASMNAVKSTTDNTAAAVFTFRGRYFELWRTVGPTQGDMEIWVDGQLLRVISNRGAVTKPNQPVEPFLGGIDAGAGNSDHRPGTWHYVVLRRFVAGDAGPVDIDRIQTYEVNGTNSLPNIPVTAMTDDRLGGTQPCATKRFCYESGTFTTETVPGALLNKVTQTTTPGAKITFRATGTTITLFRNTGPGFGSMDIYVDGVLYKGGVSNISDEARVRVPYVISGLGAYSHVVQIVNGNGVLAFDGAQASSPRPIPASTLQTNENSPSLVYSGYWTNLPTPGAVGNTLRQTSDPGASVSFLYTGNYFCITYHNTPSGASVNVFEDGALIDTISLQPGDPIIYEVWCDTFLRSDRTHDVRLEVVSGTFELDAVAAKRQVVITPSMGIVQENNPAITYHTAFGAWLNLTKRSMGGYAFQGGAARSTSVDEARLSFYMNGTGFILYTSVDPLNSGWQVYVDSSPTPLTIKFEGAEYPFIDMGRATRFRPFAYAVTGLSPGIHKIELRKWPCTPYTPPGSPERTCQTTDFIDFDGVRVFP